MDPRRTFRQAPSPHACSAALRGPGRDSTTPGSYSAMSLESFHLHPVDRFDSEIVNQAQAVEPSGTDVNMRALGVFVTQPLDGCLDLEGALPFPENHLAGVAPDTEIKALATHRAKLGAHQPLHDHG